MAAEFARPALLYSIGKDSSVLLRLAQKAFFPARPPFPLSNWTELDVWEYIALAPAISPYRAVRDEVRASIGDFVEVYVDAPLEGASRAIPRACTARRGLDTCPHSPESTARMSRRRTPKSSAGPTARAWKTASPKCWPPSTGR